MSAAPKITYTLQLRMMPGEESSGLFPCPAIVTTADDATGEDVERATLDRLVELGPRCTIGARDFAGLQMWSSAIPNYASVAHLHTMALHIERMLEAVRQGRATR